jgi:hypothetical protein
MINIDGVHSHLSDHPTGKRALGGAPFASVHMHAIDTDDAQR